MQGLGHCFSSRQGSRPKKDTSVAHQDFHLGLDLEQSHSVACPSTAYITCVLARAGSACHHNLSFLPPTNLSGFLHHSCLFDHFRFYPELAGLKPWAYLSFWILQVGVCRPWSTRDTPASPSSLVRRLSSVKVGLAWIAELMSLHRTSVRPQSSSLKTGPLS